jgi:hypothetical protein
MMMLKLLQRIVTVTRGLDPRVHRLCKMDCRVKPGNDREEAV